MSRSSGSEVSDALIQEFYSLGYKEAALMDLFVLINVMRNAVEAMEESQRRELHVYTGMAEDNMVMISVTDTGTGISDEVLDLDRLPSSAAVTPPTTLRSSASLTPSPSVPMKLLVSPRRTMNKTGQPTSARDGRHLC